MLTSNQNLLLSDAGYNGQTYVGRIDIVQSWTVKPVSIPRITPRKYHVAYQSIALGNHIIAIIDYKEGTLKRVLYKKRGKRILIRAYTIDHATPLEDLKNVLNQLENSAQVIGVNLTNGRERFDAYQERVAVVAFIKLCINRKW